MKTTVNRIWLLASLHVVLLAPALALSLPGCGGGAGGGSGGGGGGGGGGEPLVLLDEGFDGALTANWIITGIASETATIGDQEPLGTLPHGNPSPGLWLRGGTGAGYGNIRTVESFPSFELTVGVDARFDLGSVSSGSLLEICSLNGNEVLASIEVKAASVRYFAGTDTSSPFNVDTAFHQFVFNVDSSGNAEWRRDGVLQQTVAAFPSVDVYVRLRNTYLLSPISGHFDNVLVTVP